MGAPMRYLGAAMLALVVNLSAAARADDISNACETMTLCPGIKGGGRILDCLAQNINALDESCLSTLGRQWLIRRMQAEEKRAAGQAPACACPAGTSAPAPGGAPPSGSTPPQQ
jgi:hypothetical protein